MPGMGIAEDRRPPIIGFLTDFGFDGAAATCRAVMLSICPTAQIVDIAHTIPKFAVADGAFVLASAVPFFPVGVHVAVIDPGVGTERRPIAVRTQRGDVLVGPDNGLLVPAAAALGGVDNVRELSDRTWWRPAASATFHGRDVFAPVAAHLAAGSAAFEALGPAIEPAAIVRLPEPERRTGDGFVETAVTYVDSFGNLRLAGTRDDVVSSIGSEGSDLRVTIGDWPSEPVRFVATFGEVGIGDLLLYVDSNGHPALAVNQGNLGARTGARRGAPVRLERA